MSTGYSKGPAVPQGGKTRTDKMRLLLGANGPRRRTVRGELGSNQRGLQGGGETRWARQDRGIEQGEKGKENSEGEGGGGLRSQPGDSPRGGRGGSPGL